MNNRSVNIELSDEVWKVIDTQFKPLSNETDSEILSQIINHLAQNGYLPDVDSLQQGTGLKELVDIQQDMIITLLELLEKKGLTTYQEWAETMQERIIKNARSFY